MTVGAFADLRVVLAFFEVTDEAGAIGYGDVIALDYTCPFSSLLS